MSVTLRPFVGSATSLSVRLIVAFAVGGSAVLTLPPFSIILLGPIAYSAILLLLQNLSASRAALIGWAFGLGQFGFGLSWIVESFYVDAERFGALAIPAVAGLSAGLAIFQPPPRRSTQASLAGLPAEA